MRFVVGPIPSSRVLDAEKECWIPVSESSSQRFAVLALLLSTPFLVASIVVLLGLKAYLKSEPAALATLLACFVTTVPLHELLHALAYPNGLRSPYLVIGVWPRRGLCYVLYDSPLPRNRILFMLSLPFVLLTVLLAMAGFLASTEWRRILTLVLLVHTAICTGDFITFVRLVMQVPSDALVHNSGWRTYWKSMPKPIAS